MTDLTELRLPVTRRVLGARLAGGRASRPVRPGVVLAIVLIGQLMAVIDNSIVNVAVPSMAAGLHASGALLQLIVAGYTISYAVLLVTGARLGDILGHRRVFLAGAALFTLASLGCGLAPSAGSLVALRFIQGVGAAVMIPQVLSLIQRTYTSPGPRARAMSFYAAVLSGGAVLGQVLGGLLVSADLFGTTWRPIFLVNVPVGLAVLALGRLLPAADADRPQRKLDLPGLLTLTPAVLAFVLPLVLGQSLGWPAWGWALLALAGVAAVALGPVERLVLARGGQPILPRALLAAPGVATGICAMFTLMAIFGGWLFAFTLHLQDGLGDSALRSGLTFVPAALAFAFVSLNWQRVPGSGAPRHDRRRVRPQRPGPARAWPAAARWRDRWRGYLYPRGPLRRRHGGRVRPADDPRAVPRPGGDRRRRQRRHRDRQPARNRRRRGDLRYPLPEPGRAPARQRPGERARLRGVRHLPRRTFHGWAVSSPRSTSGPAAE